VDLLTSSQRIVGFTGAGVSTESGIPDFRSPGGVWTRYDPRNFEFDRYVEDPAVRRLSWEMRREFFAAGARPNPAHLAFAALERAGRSPGVITQNIDGLHQDAGSQHVVELHGTARQVLCIGEPTGATPEGCGWTAPHTWAFERLDAGEDDPACPECGRLVKSATISFGQMLDPDVVDEAVRLVRSADLLVTTGSSLQVYPAAGLPAEAVGHGVRLVIVNDEPTPYDDLAELVVRGRAGEVLGPAVEAALLS
jgi:NAD-dependent deacetylase